MSKTTNKFSPEVRERAVRLVLANEGQHPSRWQAFMSCCRFRGHEDKIVTKETEIGHGETEVHEGVQV